MGPPKTKVAFVGARVPVGPSLIALGLDNYKLEQPKELVLTASPVLKMGQYDPSLPEKKNFMHQEPPVAKKHGNNRKRTKYRR